ncbi:MAG: hypothetical protein JW909_09915, partial [Planctomycetes bacterium]|nr:hypothetical protein [Planctomycetota bacterium]
MRRLETLLAAVILASAGLFAREGASERPPKHPEDPRVHLADILDREMFTRWKLREERKETADEKPAIDIKKILDAIDRLFDRLADLWPRSDRQAASRSTGGLLITALHTLGWVIAVALAAIISYVVYRAIQGHRARARPARILSQEEIAAALEAGEALALSGTQWLSQAHKLAAGDG